MNRKTILFWFACSFSFVMACQSNSPSANKAQDKTKWIITFGTLSNQKLPPESQAEENLRRCIDGTVRTYWQSQTEAHAGMYLDLDLGTIKKIRGVSLDSSLNTLSEDYPHGLAVFGATEAGQWQELARDYNSKPVNGKVRMEFPLQEIRYLRLQLLGGVPYKWWSVCEIDLME